MLLILNGACTNSNIREDIGQISEVFRVKHLISNWHMKCLQGMHMDLSDGNQTI